MNADYPDLLARRASLSPEKLALEEVATGRRRTYSELDARATGAAAALAAHGIGAGDRVAMLCRNRIEFFELLFGCARLGAVLVPLNWRMPAAELDGLIADAQPSVIVHGDEDEAVVGQLEAPPPAVALGKAYERMIADAPTAAVRSSWPSPSTWYLLYTSGTTGRPKGVIYTYRMAVANYVNIGSCIELRAGDRVVSFLPFFHTAGINLHALPALMAGARVQLLDGFDAQALVALLEERRIDAFFAVPTVYQALLDHARFAAAPLQAVRHWGCGGAPLSDSLVERYRALGVRVCNGMGMTETGPTAFLVDPADAWNRIGSVGKPQLLSNVRIVDREGRDVADGEVGDLLFAGPGVTPGYWRNEEATRAAFTEDGWLRSGDLARRDADGFYYVVGRRKEMFISGGENIYPVEVENVLCAHPGVVDAAVIGEADPKWGEVGCAFVQLGAGARADAALLAAFCRERLAGYKVPRRFVFVDDFPRTSAGKIQKHRLREVPENILSAVD
ncbi:class I adenylate-forming enzyme family protein [Sphingosinicella terrae]|uniref:class I adenylate-forming enzyme family protein n=1 Tax=Sphingosinicella terrae TaxID=2172047 RepID=UPI000E0DDEAA|nr:AMP-binding protein [Sphingosinicella terrae]